MPVINADCRGGMATLPANSLPSMVTDPPYGLSRQPDMREVLRHWLAGDDYEHTGGGFMGKSWDSFVPGPLTWAEAFRVLKPGAYGLVFGGSRTVDLMATSLRLAGFEICDMLHWIYGTGFPKSLTLGDGLGTGLKPCHEPIILCRKPLSGTYAANLSAHGTGALNLDACRVPAADKQLAEKYASVPPDSVRSNSVYGAHAATRRDTPHPLGRWPGNILHDGILPEPIDKYFYCAKASRADRDAGLALMAMASAGELTGGRTDGSAGLASPRSGAGRTSGGRNTHPTVKPTDLMRWCVRLITPPGELVLDPFAGSGSTGRGAALEGREFLGFELSAQYTQIANARIAEALNND